jgi:hypothetical protein
VLTAVAGRRARRRPRQSRLPASPTSASDRGRGRLHRSELELPGSVASAPARGTNVSASPPPGLRAMARVVSVYRDDRLPSDCRTPLTSAGSRWPRRWRVRVDVDLATVEPRRSPPQADPDGAAASPRSTRFGVDWDSMTWSRPAFTAGSKRSNARRRRPSVHHPKLGSVVAAEDRDGIYFYGRTRAASVQCRIANGALRHGAEQPARALWQEAFSTPAPTGDGPAATTTCWWCRRGGRRHPGGGRDPYPRGSVVDAFAGNIYGRVQPEAHQVLIAKMNELGGVSPNGRAVVPRAGDTGGLDRSGPHVRRRVLRAPRLSAARGRRCRASAERSCTTTRAPRSPLSAPGSRS